MASKGITAIWQLHESIAFRGVPSEDLLRQFLAKRDDQAFRELLRRHGKDVYLQCRAVLRCEDLAHEAFQATFIALAIKGHTIKNQRSVGAWLIKTSRHKAISINRGIKARKKIEQAMGAELGDAVQRPPTASLNQQAEVFAALMELPEKYRTALTLCVIHGATHAEAAKELRWPQGTVDTRVRKGLELLKKKLERRGWGAATLALPAILATKIEAVPPGVSHAVINTAMQAMSVHTGWKVIFAGIWGLFLGYGMWLVAGVVLMGLVLGGMVYASYPKMEVTPSASSQVSNIKLLRQQIHQKNQQIFRSEVVPKVQAALQKLKLWNEPVKVVDVYEREYLLICTIEQRCSLGNSTKPLLTTRTRWHYNLVNGAVHVNIDPQGENQWREMSLSAPIRLDNPWTGAQMAIPLPEVQEAIKAFNQLAVEPYEQETPAQNHNPHLLSLRPYLGEWHSENVGQASCHILINESGNPLYIHSDGRVSAIVRSSDELRWDISDWNSIIVSEDKQRMTTLSGEKWRR